MQSQLVVNPNPKGNSKMPANDAIALDANFKSWSQNRFPNGAPKNINIFEYYSLDQLLRQYSIGDSQIKAGMVGGGDDGGIDGLYMFVNNEMVDAESELDPETAESIKILIVQIKEGSGFPLLR